VTLPYLKSEEPENLSGALAVLYRLRAYRPRHDLEGGEGSAWEQKYKPKRFWDRLDQEALSSLDHIHEHGGTQAFSNLALYLGVSPSPASRRALLRIANETAGKSQAVTCLAWHRTPGDMDHLLPLMLEDSAVADSLPYHFRISYGEAALPYLEQATTEAKSEKTRQKAKEELKTLQDQLPGHRE
ncbi:MAG: hypothetical protein AAF492_02410, partial [Verrucomicrobiota bacterium]